MVSLARRKARTPEARENQLIDMAIDLVEKQIAEEKVSPLVLAHYVRMGSTKERLEREKLKAENEHLKAKVEAIKSLQRSEEDYKRALEAFKSYSGRGQENYDDQDLF